MMKKAFSMLLAVTMVLGMMPMNTFAAHSHSWKEAADKTYHFCSCGEKCYGSVTEEILVNCSNNQGKKVTNLGCLACDFVRTGNIFSTGEEHVFNGGETCTLCGQPNPGYAPECTVHDWKHADGKCRNFGCDASHVHADTTPAEPKKCGTGGYNTAEMCDTCGWMIKVGTPVPATHNYVSGECTACGQKEPQAHPHTYGTDGKCTVDGCDAECPHTNTTLVYRDCVNSDYDYRECDTCKKVTNNVVPQNRNAHSFDEDGVCSYCGAKDPECDHDWVMGECSKCHTHHQCASSDIETIMPNCVEGGYITKRCKVCKAVEVMNTPVAAGAHKFNSDGICTVCGQEKPANCEHPEWKDSICTQCGETCQHDMLHTNNATCLEYGYKTDKCKICDYLVIERIEALGHDMGEWYQTKAPTYTQFGEERRDCQREGCDFYETRPIDKLVYIAPSAPIGVTYYTITNEVEGLELSHSRAKAGTRIDMLLEDDTLNIVEIIAVDSKDTELKIKEDTKGYYFLMPASDVVVSEYKLAFTDVDPNGYYYDAVLWAVRNGITTGTGNGTTFSPNMICSRAQVVTFLWRAAGSPAPVSTEMPFTDVAADAYYYDAVLWAVEKGITNGTGDGTTFSPDADCSRAQIVTFLWRSEGMEEAKGENVFTDVPAGAYYTEAVQWAVEKGITNGTGDGTTFSPEADCTRAQIVTFLYRLFN